MINGRKVANWISLKNQLKELKEQELKLRLELIEEAFPQQEEGTYKLVLPTGDQLVGRRTYIRTLDQDLAEVVQAELPDVIRVKYELNLQAYRKLIGHDRYQVDQILITKPGTPRLDYVVVEE